MGTTSSSCPCTAKNTILLRRSAHGMPSLCLIARVHAIYEIYASSNTHCVRCLKRFSLSAPLGTPSDTGQLLLHLLQTQPIRFIQVHGWHPPQQEQQLPPPHAVAAPEVLPATDLEAEQQQQEGAAPHVPRDNAYVRRKSQVS
jgi:hypothetical protein